jgi:hypothetical protein
MRKLVGFLSLAILANSLSAQEITPEQLKSLEPNFRQLISQEIMNRCKTEQRLYSLLSDLERKFGEAEASFLAGTITADQENKFQSQILELEDKAMAELQRVSREKTNWIQAKP